MRRFVRWMAFVALVVVAWHWRMPLSAAGMFIWRKAVGSVPETEALKHSPGPDQQSYRVLVADLERWRALLAAQHRKARGAAERAAVEHDARVVLEVALPAMMRCWLGTPWDFNGTASGPGRDPIACGYFVATVLKDAGFKVDRYRLAKQPSSRILQAFLPKSDCELVTDRPYDEFAAATERRDRGVYLVGLDTHVAFLVVDDGGFRFIHSSGSDPWCVVDEDRDGAQVLRRSRWRMLGNLTASTPLVRRWLANDPIPVPAG